MSPFSVNNELKTIVMPWLSVRFRGQSANSLRGKRGLFDIRCTATFACCCRHTVARSSSRTLLNSLCRSWKNTYRRSSSCWKVGIDNQLPSPVTAGTRIRPAGIIPSWGIKWNVVRVQYCLYTGCNS